MAKAKAFVDPLTIFKAYLKHINGGDVHMVFDCLTH